MAKDEWTRSPQDPVYSVELLLPSFGTRITNSDPRTEAHPPGLGSHDLNPDSGDAFSVSYLYSGGATTPADRDFAGLHPGYVRRILLRVLDGEEYPDILDHHNARNRLEVRSNLPEGARPTYLDMRRVKDPDPQAQVRLTDLRLAGDITPRNLKLELESALPDLPLPVTSEDVRRWKHKTLRNIKGMLSASDLAESEDRLRAERDRIIAISFAAAALCLFIDLDMENIEGMGRDDLVEQVSQLAEVVRELISKVDGSVDLVSRLLAARTGTRGGRPPDPEVKHYTALVLHRMGRPAFEVARRVGLSSPDPPEWKEDSNAGGSRSSANWKQRLASVIEKGIEIEQKKMPVVSGVFARSEEESIREAARATYLEYLESQSWAEVAKHREPFDLGDDLLGAPMDEKWQEVNALIQLGSCIENGIDPFPTAIR